MIVGCGAANRLLHYVYVLSLVWGQDVRRPEYFNLNKMNKRAMKTSTFNHLLFSFKAKLLNTYMLIFVCVEMACLRLQ